MRPLAGEQARIQLAIGRDPGARAGGTKGLRHAGDDAVHEFDEAHDVATALETPRHRHDVLIVDAFLDHCSATVSNRGDEGQSRIIRWLR